MDRIPSDIQKAYAGYVEARQAHYFLNRGDIAMQMNGAKPKVTRRFRKVYKLCAERGLNPVAVIGQLSTEGAWN